MNLGKSSDYTLSFQAKGIPFLMTDLFARGYDGVNVLDIWKDGLWSEYFPLEAYQRHGQAGLALYEDTAKFQQHTERLQLAQTHGEKYAKGLINSATFSRSDLSQLFESWLDFLRLYFCLGIEYTELAAQQENNPTISKNLQHLQEIKNPAREYLNQHCIKDDSYLNIILNKLEKRSDIPTEELWQYTLAEVLEVFDQKYVTPETIKARVEIAITQIKDGNVSYAWGEEALNLLKTFEQTQTEETSLLSGSVANKHSTIIQGRATIIKVDYQDFTGMNAKMATMPQGSILIAQTTAPELMVAIKKAAAIVTDLGGLMSHAAIVARELNIPCLVGTQHATKTFKDGDLVEVDTETGTIRKII